MTFADFIKKSYSAPEQKEINVILQDLLVYDNIECSLNDFYQAADSQNKIEIISQFVLTCREFVTALYKPVHDIKFDTQKARIEKEIIEFANYLICDTYRLSGLKPFEYFELLKQTVKRTYSKHSWDFSLLEKRLNPDNIKTFAVEETEKKMRTSPNFRSHLNLAGKGKSI